MQAESKLNFHFFKIKIALPAVILMILLSELFFACNKAFAQTNQPKFTIIKCGAQFGFIMQHRNTMGHLVNSHIHGINLDLGFSTHGNALWQFENNFPERGFSLSYFNLGNPKQLGYLFALAPYYDIPLKSKDCPSRLYMRLAFGAAYLTKKFDPIENHKNNVMSVGLNGYVNFRWFYRFKLATQNDLELGLNFCHASNAKFKAPNLGVNILTLQTVYRISTSRKSVKMKSDQAVLQIDSSAKPKSKNEIVLHAAFGINEIEPPGGKKYLAQVYEVSYFRNVRNTHKFGGGIEIINLGATKDLLWIEDSVKTSGALNTSAIGSKFAYAYVIGRTIIPVEMGVYIKNPYKTDGLFYHRIGIRYFFKNNLIASLTLRTHWAVANHFEIGLGYKFSLKK